MAVKDSDRILAAGVPVVLAGREMRLRFGLRALKLLEDKFGSLQVIEQLTNGDGKVIGPLCTIIAAGLSHEGVTEDDILDNVSPGEIQTLMDAAAVALAEAFPDTEGKAEAAAPAASPGIPGTGSRPAATAEAMTVSGA